MKRTRRNFITTGGTALAGTSLLGSLPLTSCSGLDPWPKEFGFQIWTVREQLIADFPGTLKKMADMGYTQVEMCSPLGYEGTGLEVFQAMSGREMRRVIEDAGLSCPSTHINQGDLNQWERFLEWAQGMEISQMAMSMFWIPKEAGLDEYRREAEKLNLAAEKSKAAGIQMLYHNHHHEFEKRGDTLVYDALMEAFDPPLVKMQFQVAVYNIGYRAVDYFRKYPGRIQSAHLADWSAEQDKQVPIGQGDIDWDEFFQVARDSGVKNYFVEMAPETFEPSAAFLKKASL